MSLERFILELNAFGDQVGAPLIVALFYWFRFHTLKGTRSYTTLGLYCAGLVTFILPFMLAYFLISYLVQPSQVPSSLSASSLICIVLLIWLLVPGAPRSWRNFCQSLASIPFYAYSLRTLLASSPFELRREDWPDISRRLARVGYKTDDLQAIQSTAIQSRFLKITAIMFHLGEWKSQGSVFLARNAEHYSDLLTIYDLLSFKAVRAFKCSETVYGAIMEDSKVEPDDWNALDTLNAQDSSSNRLQAAAQDAVGCMLEDLRKDMDFLLDHLLLLVARHALASEWTFAGRKRILESIGFTVTRPAQPIVGMVAAAAAIIVAIVVIWFAVTRHWQDLFPGDPMVGALRSFVMSPLNIALNMFIVYHFKRNYAFANEGLFGGFPIKFILSIGVLTALLLFPIQAVFDFYQFRNGEFGTFMNVVVHELPVLLYFWATGAVMALLVQESIWDGFASEPASSVMDGVAFGVTMLLAIAAMFAVNDVFTIPIMAKMPPLWSLQTIFGIFGFSFVAGFALGFLLMARVRAAASLRFGREGAVASAALARG